MSGYIGASPVPQATQHREAFTATASQTSFATAGYTPQFLDVYLNGVKLAAADYTATNGSDIVLTTGAAASDILEYVAYTPFEVADQTFTGTTTTDVLTTTGAFTSLGIDDNATSTAITIDASENVGIGEAAPATLLHLSANNAGITTAGTGNNTLRFEDNDPTKLQGQVTGTIDWYTNDVDATGVQAWITADSTNVGAGALAFGTGVAGATAERLRIDSSGKVGIGTTGMHGQLTVAQGSNDTPTQIVIENTDSNIEPAQEVNNLEFYTNDSSAYGTGVTSKISQYAENPGNQYGLSFSTYNLSLTEAMRIDSSGNVLMGKTTADNTTEGFTFYGEHDGVSIVKANGEPLILNRLTNDGSILTLRKDGTTVGSIGTTGGYLTVTASGGSDAGAKLGNSAIFPCNTDGSDRDAGINLGLSTVRWKDLYLSGGVYLGGVGAANKLDDYEEGLFTVTFVDLAGNPVSGFNYGDRAGSYTKIGNTVNIRIVLGTSLTPSDAGLCYIALPFQVTSVTQSAYASVAPLTRYLTFGTNQYPILETTKATSRMAILKCTADGTTSHVTNADLGNAFNLNVSLTYQTDA